MQRTFMGSVIFGAKNLQQLETALRAQDLKLSDEVIKGVDEIQRAHPMPF